MRVGAQRAQCRERVLVERAAVRAPLFELVQIRRAQARGERIGFRSGRDRRERLPACVLRLERRDAGPDERRDVVVRTALCEQRRRVITVLAQRLEPVAQRRRRDVARALVEVAQAIAECSRPRRAFVGGRLQLRERGVRRAHLRGVRGGLLEAALQRAQRRIDGRALCADVFCDRAIEPPERAERRVLARATVERACQRRADHFGARALDPDRALAHAGGVDEDLDRDAEVGRAGRDRAPLRRRGGDVAAVAVVDAYAFGIAFEVALHFERAAVAEHVAQGRAVAPAAPRAPALAFAAGAVERRDDRRRERRLAGFVRAVDDDQPGVERERAIVELAEPAEMQVEQSHGSICASSKAATQ